MIDKNDSELNSTSCYLTVAAINQQHRVYLVQHQDTQKFYVRKDLDVYSTNIYNYLMHHPVKGIPKIIEYHVQDGLLTVIEEFISGKTLRELLDSGETNILTIGEFIINLCDILGELHSQNPPIIHRDIKPSNIIITPFGNVVLVDFNAAKFYSNISGKEQDTKLLGTQGYAAPEQFGFGESSPQTDIYSIGVLLKEAVSILTKHDDLYDGIIEKCTKIEQSKRFQSVKNLKNALIKCLISRNYPGYTNDISFNVISFFPPGFRTMTPWKMITAITVYFFIALFCASLNFKDTTPTQAVIERITIFIILISYILILFNYGHVQDGFPLCKSNSFFIRFIGIIALMTIITFGVFFMMLFIFSAFNLR